MVTGPDMPGRVRRRAHRELRHVKGRLVDLADLRLVYGHALGVAVVERLRELLNLEQPAPAGRRDDALERGLAGGVTQVLPGADEVVIREFSGECAHGLRGVVIEQGSRRTHG